MDVRTRLSRARRRFEPTVLGRIAQVSIAAGGAWELAQQIPGHGRPFFAPIAAMIALGGEPGRRGRQAIEMIAGVAFGILLATGLLEVVGTGGGQIVLGVALVFLLAAAFATRPMIRNQAAASVILVLALHEPGSNLTLQRLIDALIGGILAILLAQFLFPADPLTLVRR